MLRWRTILALVSAAALWPPVARAQVVPDSFTVETLASGLAAPTGIAFLPDGRLLFTEQFTGRIRVFREGTGVQATPVLTIAGVATGGERGLLGIAVDPLYPARPYVYVHATMAAPNHIRIARFTLTGNVDGTGAGDLLADAASRFDLLDDLPDNAPNHNGGTVRFGPDGRLYVSLGEDAAPCAAQDSTSLRGVILRLRTDGLPAGPGAATRAQLAPADNPFAAAADTNLRLVDALGLRNPFRFQIDGATGALVIADVGESLREEIDLLGDHPVTPGLASPGADFGWPYLEGNAPGPFRNDCGAIPANLVPPIFEYDRTQQAFGAAVISAGRMRTIGGRARGWPAAYDGDIFANDYYEGDLRRLTSTTGTWQIADPVPGQAPGAAWGTGFKEIPDWRLGPDGALWFCRQSQGFAANTGSIGRISGRGTPSPPPAGFMLAIDRQPSIGRLALRAAAPGIARLRVYDLSGRLVRTLHEGTLGQPAGSVTAILWDGRDDAGTASRPGVYLVSLAAAGKRLSRTIIFLR